MKSQSILFTLFVLFIMLALAACGGSAAPTEPSERFIMEAPATEAPAATQAPVMPDEFGAPESVLKAGNEGAVAQSSDALALPMPTTAAFEINNQSGENIIVQNTNRKIIK